MFEGNLRLIKEYDRDLAAALLALDNLRQSFELTMTGAGEHNLKVNGLELHSSKSAVEEAANIARNISNIDEENSLCVLFGLGLGYLFDEVVARAKGNVILIEPNIEILKCTLEIVDLTHLLSKKNVRLCADMDTLQRHTTALSDESTKITVSFLTPYYNVYRAQIKEIATIMECFYGEKAAVDNTIKMMGEFTVRNTLNNLHYLESGDAYFIKDFKDAYKGCAALVVSAGPSLGKNIETIKANRDKFVIFCVGQALKLLLDNDIVPDFGVLIEAKETYGQLHGLNLSGVSMIFEPYTNSLCWGVKAKEKIMFLSQKNFLNDFLARTLKIDNEGIASLGTVSYSALNSAQIMGCDPIILIGQDLAYLDGKCYAKGSIYEGLDCILNKDEKFEIVLPDGARESYKKAICVGKTGDEAEKFVEDWLQHLNNNLYTVNGQNGEKLPTQSCYVMFVKYFETFAAHNFKHAGVKARLVNSSTGGAQIDGFENIPLNEVAKSLAVLDKAPVTIARTKFDMENIHNAIKNRRENIKEALAYLGQTRVELEKFKKETGFRKAASKNAQKLFDKISDRHSAFEKIYFNKNELVYWSAYAGCKGISEILEKGADSLIQNFEKFKELFELLEKNLETL